MFWIRWELNKTEWWENIQPYQWATGLVECAQKYHDVVILTKPKRICPASATGKMLWLSRHFPELSKNKRIVLSSYKHLLATQDRILVDDYTTMCEYFCRAGGRAVLFPQPWNKSDISIDRFMKALHDGESLDEFYFNWGA